MTSFHRTTRYVQLIRFKATNFVLGHHAKDPSSSKEALLRGHRLLPSADPRRSDEVLPAQRPFWKRRRRQRQRLLLHLLAGLGGVRDGVVVQEGKVVVRKAAWIWLLRGLSEFRLPAEDAPSTGFHSLPKPAIFQPEVPTLEVAIDTSAFHCTRLLGQDDEAGLLQTPLPVEVEEVIGYFQTRPLTNCKRNSMSKMNSLSTRMRWCYFQRN